MKRTCKEVKPVYGKDKKRKEIKENSKRKQSNKSYSPFEDSMAYHESFC